MKPIKLLVGVSLGVYLLLSIGYAQQITIGGYVQDSSGEVIVGAGVWDSAANQRSITNASGFFSLQVPAGNHELNVLHMSYVQQRIPLFARRDTQIQIILQPRTLATVHLIAEAPSLRPLSQMSVVRLPMEVIRSLPALLGEKDIIKALALMPGVSIGTEGTSGLLVRGGSADQNLFLLDGTPVYNASHLFGFVSIFDPGVLKDVALYKGGFPARYGGRLSSVLDIQMREGAGNTHQGEASIGILSSRMLVEGPVWKGRGSYLISGRGSYLGLLALPLKLVYQSGGTGTYVNYWMADANVKLNYTLSATRSLSLSIYGGYDRYTALEGSGNNDEQFGLAWGNQTASLRYKHSWANKWFSQATLYVTRYQYGLDTKETSSVKEGDTLSTYTQRLRSSSLVQDMAGKYTLEGYMSRFLTLRAGAEISRHRFRPSLIRSEQVDTTREEGAATLISYEGALYAEGVWKIGSRLEFNSGLRTSFYFPDRTAYIKWEPRFSLGYQLPGQYILKASYSRMHQYIHLLTNSGAGLPNDVWIPVTANIPPSSSNQWAVGVEKTIPRLALYLSLEAYVKYMQKLTDYPRGANFFSIFSSDWEQLLVKNGEGRVKGIELFVQRTKGRANGWIAYTLSWNERRFSSVDGGEWRPYRFDRRNMIQVAGFLRISDAWKFSMAWTYSTGAPVTVPVAIQLDAGGAPVWVYGQRNNFRLPDQHRLDIGFERVRVMATGQKRTLSLGLYNAYNRQNPFYVEIDQRYDPLSRTWSYALVQRSLFPILPSVSYSWQF